MKVREYLKCLPVAEAVIQTLDATGRTMTYGEFGRAIGLVAGAWERRHIKEVSHILNLLSAIDRKFNNGKNTLNFRVIVNAQSGEPGSGIDGNGWSIVTTPASDLSPAKKAWATIRANLERGKAEAAKAGLPPPLTPAQKAWQTIRARQVATS